MAEFTQEELEAEAATADTAEAPPVARDEQGRFAPAEIEDEQEEAPAAAPERTQRMVPHGALHAEREARKADRAELAAAREQLDQLKALRDRIAATRAAPVEPEAPQAEPEDPTGINHLKTRLSQLEGGFRERQTQEADQGVAQQESQILYSGLMQSEAAFRAQTPDYDQAATHLAQARARQLQMMGFQPHEVQQTIADEVLQITRAAIEQGREPAELAYQWAQTYGYSPQAKQEQAVNPMLAAIAQGQKNSRSLANGRGGATASDVNANAVAAMNDAEFEALYATAEGRRLLDAMG
jgi:hypothetical protein